MTAATLRRAVRENKTAVCRKRDALVFKILRYLGLPEDVSGYRPTWKRLSNVYLNRYETTRLRRVLRSWPTRLVIEPTNACNLRCPYCHTGAGRHGRKPGMLRFDVYAKLLDEIGDYLLLVEVFNWGEPLFHPELPEIIAAASARGISTRVNTHFSVPFHDRDAERLVESGLTDLFVSVDGPTQEVYERYRVGGDLDLVVRNCRLMAETKKRLGAELPRLTMQFLEFPFNVGEEDGMRRLAEELGMQLFAIRGAVPDPAWGWRDGGLPWFLTHKPAPCPFLWGQPVLTVDGNVAPCRGVFQSFDDVAHLAAGANEPGAASFREIWNHERYQTSRGFFGRRDGSDAERRSPCYECPTTIFWERWFTHRKGGGTLESFAPGMVPSANGAWNYFWERGQRKSAAPTAREETDATPDVTPDLTPDLSPVARSPRA